MYISYMYQNGDFFSLSCSFSKIGDVFFSPTETSTKHPFPACSLDEDDEAAKACCQSSVEVSSTDKVMMQKSSGIFFSKMVGLVREISLIQGNLGWFPSKGAPNACINFEQMNLWLYHGNPQFSFIFRGYNIYNPYCWECKTFIFHGFGVQGYRIHGTWYIFT